MKIFLAGASGAVGKRLVPLLVAGGHRVVGRLAIGEAGVSMMTQVRGSSNAKARRALGWQPRYASWRVGFRQGLSAELPRTAYLKAM